MQNRLDAEPDDQLLEYGRMAARQGVGPRAIIRTPRRARHVNSIALEAEAPAREAEPNRRYGT